LLAKSSSAAVLDADVLLLAAAFLRSRVMPMLPAAAVAVDMPATDDVELLHRARRWTKVEACSMHPWEEAEEEEAAAVERLPPPVAVVVV